MISDSALCTLIRFLLHQFYLTVQDHSWQVFQVPQGIDLITNSMQKQGRFQRVMNYTDEVCAHFSDWGVIVTKPQLTERAALGHVSEPPRRWLFSSITTVLGCAAVSGASSVSLGRWPLLSPCGLWEVTKSTLMFFPVKLLWRMATIQGIPKNVYTL